ncbi:CDP-glycerol glycerophosphotransferase family protein [Clostridium saudiense]|uniref:CDP-glycerol glycerophosphotransferase family protein n=1 Tax=Clostridium saudiense TaxID=1414720 RepID=UPI0018AC6A59
MLIVNFFKIIISYLISRISKKYTHNWLICERGDDARDNGYWFYKYLNKEHEEIYSIYCIDDDSSDFRNINDIGSYVRYGSIAHGVAFFSADFLISTHPPLCIPPWQGIGVLEKIGLLKIKSKKVFLQHGITKDYIEALTVNKLHTDLFICGAQPEYEYILDNFGFDKRIVKYTGFSRFDNLHDSNLKQNNEKILLIMPTWRQWMSQIENQVEFEKSEYYCKFQSLLNNAELMNFIENEKWKIIFYPHYEVQKWITSFYSVSNNVIIADLNRFDVQKLLIKCNIAITDFSSIFFDIAYMKKPVIFYQFDYSEYRKNHYHQGYYRYEDGLGPVAYSEDKVIQLIIQVIEKGIDKKYIDKYNEFFPKRDNKNCMRIYNEIMEIKLYE